MKVAALDLGTNTFLLLIAELDAAGKMQILHDEAVVVRLGENVHQSGVLSAAALLRAENCLQSFKKTIDRFHVSKVLAQATSAARDAKNGSELFAIGKKYDIPIEIIAGNEEAEISFKGASSALLEKKEFHNKNILVIDIGGGSTELILGSLQKGIQLGKSLNIGSVRLTEMFIHQQPTVVSEVEKLEKHIQNSLAALPADLKIDILLAVAGTPTTLVALDYPKFDAEKVEGRTLTLEKLQQWKNLWESTSVEEKKQKWKLGGRADVILAGTLILISVLKYFNFAECLVSTRGVRFGIAYKLLQEK